MNQTIVDFIEAVSEKDKFQKKRLMNLKINELEQEELVEILRFFIERLKYRMEDLADAYVFINQMVMEEIHFFLMNGRYRYSSFAEMEQKIYANEEYMRKYMCGLSIANYIWMNHVG